MLIYETSIILDNNIYAFVLIHTDKHSLNFSSRKLLLATEGDQTPENQNQSKCRLVEPSLNGHIYKTLPHLKLRKKQRR